MHNDEIEMRNAMSAEFHAVAVEHFGELAFLARTANDLDLTNSEDRAIFRMRVSDKLKATTVDAMRGWVAGSMRDRYSAERAVADAYIARALAV
jgi:hypothetical protein